MVATAATTAALFVAVWLVVRVPAAALCVELALIEFRAASQATGLLAKARPEPRRNA